MTYILQYNLYFIIQQRIIINVKCKKCEILSQTLLSQIFLKYLNYILFKFNKQIIKKNILYFKHMYFLNNFYF